MYTICICGGGSLGHVIAGWLSARDHAKVNILTNRPEKWNYEIEVDTPEGSVLKGKISMISKYPKEVVPWHIRAFNWIRNYLYQILIYIFDHHNRL